MTRPLRLQLPDGTYHVTSRGNRQAPIFVDDRDRAVLLDVLARGMSRFDATVLAYCLMGNHYHVVVQTRRGNLSRLMRHVNGIYAQAFNRRHVLAGHVFQGRFHSVHVDRDAYLAEVCRYTELNPVRAQMVDHPADWAWSSYRAHCGHAAVPEWLDTPTLHGRMLGRDIASNADRAIAAAQYARFVAAGRDVRIWDRDLRQDIYLGDDAFVRRIQARMGAQRSADVEIPQIQRRMPKSQAARSEASESRNESVRRAYLEDGMTMTAIARAVGLSVSRVSRLIRLAERP